MPSLQTKSKHNQKDPSDLKSEGLLSCRSLLAFGSAIILGVAGLALILRVMGSFLIISEPLDSADALVILSGGEKTRIDEAVLIFQDQYTDHIIITETGVEIPDWGTSYSSLMKFELIQSGIPENAIMVTDIQVQTTYDEAIATKELLQSKNMDSLIIVTDPFHTRRTKMIFNQILAGSNIETIIRPVRNHWYNSKTWWFTSTGRKATIREFFGLVEVFLRDF
ncbi:MAG: YdcF family protein [Anaerolineaceae bacterium]|nr:YdcF family protein [Anaerolineaceae bacterium]